MPGAGKSEAAQYLEKKGVPFIRFGAFSKDLIAEEVVHRALQGFRFIPEEIAHKTTDEFLKR